MAGMKKGKQMSGTTPTKKGGMSSRKGPSTGKSMKNSSKKSYPSKGRKTKK